MTLDPVCASPAHACNGVEAEFASSDAVPSQVAFMSPRALFSSSSIACSSVVRLDQYWFCASDAPGPGPEWIMWYSSLCSWPCHRALIRHPSTKSGRLGLGGLLGPPEGVLVLRHVVVLLRLGECVAGAL